MNTIKRILLFPVKVVWLACLFCFGLVLIALVGALFLVFAVLVAVVVLGLMLIVGLIAIGPGTSPVLDAISKALDTREGAKG